MSSHAQRIGKPIRSALIKLHERGAAALKPTKHPIEGRRRPQWRRPVVSKRVANDLRKKSIREGTYGTYNAEKGIGWDSKWDEGLYGGKNVGKVNWMEVRGFKETKRERTRESRSKRIDGLLDNADDKIAEFRQKNRESKPEGGIENVFKRLTRGSD